MDNQRYLQLIYFIFNVNNQQYLQQPPRQPWSITEDLRLVLLVILVGVGNWMLISRVVGRTPLQCRRRFIFFILFITILLQRKTNLCKIFIYNLDTLHLQL